VRNQDGVPVRASFRGLPAVPADQVVTGLIPHEPPNFQTPEALASLSDDPVCVVTGQRGVGKTQVAAAYARERVRDGWLVAWIGAATEDQIKAGMVELGDRLGLHRSEDSTDVIATRVRNHLQSRSAPALLVFDNVVSLDSVHSYLPSAGAVQVVMTSTVRGSQIGREVPVEVFDPETSLRFLRDATGLDDDVAAAELARELGHLPLALAQAAARIKAARWTCAKYLENFRRFPAAKYLSRRDGDPYPQGAATSILMALEPFQDSELVELLSVLSPEGVSRQLLAEDGDDVDDELTRLREASLVDFAGDSSVLMHRLVQRVIRDRRQEIDTGSGGVELASRLLLHRVRSISDPWEDRHFGYELVRQIEALWANTSPAVPVDVSAAVIELRMWESLFLRAVADTSHADRIAAEVYAESVARLGENHQLVPKVRRAVALRRTTEPEELEQLQNDFITCLEELGAKHLDTLRTASLLGEAYLRHKRAQEAVVVLEQALEPWPAQQRNSDEQLLMPLTVLGSAYTAVGRAEDAVSLFEGVLQSQRPTPSTLAMMAQLSLAYEIAGRLDDARTVSEQAWDVSRRNYGSDHPLTLLAAGQLGQVLARCGEGDKARALLKVAHAIAVEVLGQHQLTTRLARSLLKIQQD
jgi:tetratricopeptide (TPR) repeat protein